MPQSSPVLLLATSAPRYMSDFWSRTTGPKSSVVRRSSAPAGPSSTTATPHPAGWLRAATRRFPRQDPSV
eukprot:1639752-Alexandrium_andersonii.AAC.1